MIIKYKTILATLVMLNTTTLFSDTEIQITSCYGNPHKLIVEGRVLDNDKEEHNEQKSDDGWFKNSWHKLKHLINNEIKNEPITLKVAQLEKETKTDDEGYFEFELLNNKEAWENNQNVQLTLNKKDIKLDISALILNKSITKGVISDFDDTIIISDVTHKLKLLSHTFFKNYKQRQLVQVVAKKIKASNAPLFIVTGSPRQLQSSIDDFLDYHHFPKRTIITKKAHGDNADALFDQLAYKTSKIEQLIELYPEIVWDCFGDSGEKDKEVYLALAKKYPKKIGKIYIRDVKNGKIKSWK